MWQRGAVPLREAVNSSFKDTEHGEPAVRRTTAHLVSGVENGGWLAEKLRTHERNICIVLMDLTAF